MERTRRNLRNTSNCPEVGSFLLDEINSEDLHYILPDGLVKKIGKRQKISCNNVLELPEMRCPDNVEQALEQCRRAVDYQGI